MADISDLRKKLTARLEGLVAGEMQLRAKLAELQSSVTSTCDTINATAGAVQECRKLLEMLGDDAPAPDYLKLGEKPDQDQAQI